MNFGIVSDFDIRNWDFIHCGLASWREKVPEKADLATEPDFGGPLPDEIQDYENDGPQ